MAYVLGQLDKSERPEWRFGRLNVGESVQVPVEQDFKSAPEPVSKY
jgi:hypothetical protein